MSNLKNDWQEETYYLFEDAPCFWCDKRVSGKGNRPDALHHILGRCSNSPLNACSIHNFDCHIGNGKLSHKEVKKELLLKTLHYLLRQDYILTEKDKKFLNNHKEFYEL